MKFLLTFVLAPVIFIAGLLGSGRAPGGVDRPPPTNNATLQLEHLWRIAPRMISLGLLLALLGVGLACVAEQAGLLAVVALLLAVCAPRISRASAITATADFDAAERPGLTISAPVAAATHLYAGPLLALNTAGYLVAAADTAGLRVLGRSEGEVDNSAGAAGDLSANVKRGIFRYKQSATNPITQAYLRKKVYVEDDTTVAITSTYKVVAGRVVAFDATWVWIDTREGAATGLIDNTGGTASNTLAAGVGITTLSIPIILSKLGNADMLTTYTPGYAFKILGTAVAVTSPATTAAKLATLTPKVSGVAVTGGVLALTSANMTPLGAVVAGTAVTAGNTGTAADTISITGSAVTAFVEGEAVLLLKIQNLDTANAIASLVTG